MRIQGDFLPRAMAADTHHFLSPASPGSHGAAGTTFDVGKETSIGQGASEVAMMMTLVVLGTVASLAGGAYFLVRSRGRQPVAFPCFRCPACGQKVRYASEKAGRAGTCPRCKERWALPTTPDSTTLMTD